MRVFHYYVFYAHNHTISLRHHARLMQYLSAELAPPDSRAIRMGLTVEDYR